MSLFSFIPLFTLMLALPAASSTAQGYPDHSIKLVVPYSAGGGIDASARVFADGISKELGQPVIVENRPGAGAKRGDWCVSVQGSDRLSQRA